MERYGETWRSSKDSWIGGHRQSDGAHVTVSTEKTEYIGEAFEAALAN